MTTAVGVYVGQQWVEGLLVGLVNDDQVHPIEQVRVFYGILPTAEGLGHGYETIPRNIQTGLAGFNEGWLDSKQVKGTVGLFQQFHSVREDDGLLASFQCPCDHVGEHNGLAASSWGAEDDSFLARCDTCPHEVNGFGLVGS
jgi:hypothetical protein